MVPTSHSPRVLATVLNWCAAEDSAACVRSLMVDTSAVVDVLIVDNASPDGSGEVLRAQFPEHHHLQTGSNLGYAGGNLRAMEWALVRNYEFILIINDDAEVAPGCVGALVDALVNSPRAGAAAPTIVHHGTNIVWFAGGERSHLKAMGSHSHFGQTVEQTRQSESQTHAVSFLSGCCVMFRAQTLRECGGFREEFFAYVEDLEISLRFTRAGWSLLYVPAATASHKVPYPAKGDSAFAIRLRDVNRRRLVKLHYGIAEKLGFALWFYPTRLVHLARYVATRDKARISAIWNGMTESV